MCCGGRAQVTPDLSHLFPLRNRSLAQPAWRVVGGGLFTLFTLYSLFLLTWYDQSWSVIAYLCSRAAGSNLFWAPGTGFMEDDFSTDNRGGWLKHLTVIMHFIPTIMASPPPQIVRHEVPEMGDPWSSDHLKSPAADKHPFAGSSSLNRGAAQWAKPLPRQPRTCSKRRSCSCGRTALGAELVLPAPFKYPKYRGGCEQNTSMSCAWVTPCSKQAEHNPGSVAFYANNSLTVFSVKKTWHFSKYQKRRPPLQGLLSCHGAGRSRAGLRIAVASRGSGGGLAR